MFTRTLDPSLVLRIIHQTVASGEKWESGDHQGSQTTRVEIQVHMRYKTRVNTDFDTSETKSQECD